MHKYIKIIGLNSCVFRRKQLRQIVAYVKDMGWQLTLNNDQAQEIWIWTCGFRADSAQKSLQVIKEVSQLNAKVVVTGCLSSIWPQEIKRIAPNVKIVTWKEIDRSLPPIDFIIEPKLCDDAAEYRRKTGKFAAFNDQFWKCIIQEGCPQNCAYCTERLAFPRHRSVPLNKLLQALAEVPHNETVMLLGDCPGAWGVDAGQTLSDLLYAIPKHRPDLRIAINNLHPLYAIENLSAILDLIKTSRLYHLNLPIQSGSDRVLAAMGRTVKLNDLKMLFKKFRAVGFRRYDTHIICGFPGETTADWLKTMAFVAKYGFQYVLSSVYFETPEVKSFPIQPKVPYHRIYLRMKLAKIIFKLMRIKYNLEGGSMANQSLATLKQEINEN